MIYVGVDQSYAATGVAVWNSNERVIVIFSVKTLSSEDLYRRISLIHREVKWCMKLGCGGFYCEATMGGAGSSGRSNLKTLDMLARLQGILIYEAYQLGIPYKIMATGGKYNQTWYRGLGASAPKEQWVERLKEILGLRKFRLMPEFSLDETDALGILWAGLVEEGVVSVEELRRNEIRRVEHFTPIRKSRRNERDGSGREESSQFHSKLLAALKLSRVSEEVLP